MFILSNRMNKIFMGCYTSLEKAKEAHHTLISSTKGAMIPACMIEEVEIDAPTRSYFGGYDFKARWVNETGEEWIKTV